MGALGTPKGVCFMFLKTDNPRTVYLSKVDDYLVSWLEAFLIDRKSAGLAEGSLGFYRQKLSSWQTSVMPGQYSRLIKLPHLSCDNIY
jgi:hypothetical protein